MKKCISNIIFALIFLAGLSLLLYPYISNEWNTYRQSRLIDTYEKSISEMTEEEIDYTIKAVKEVVEYLRGISPIWRDLVSGKKEFVIK